MNISINPGTLLLAVCFAFGTLAKAQQPAASGGYDPHAAFSPLFYTQNGNTYRSASGYPGPAYWQNRADYTISAKLDATARRVSGTVTISYRNNSPDELPYLWLQLDQNLFAEKSRGNGVIKAGSRYGVRGEQFSGGYALSHIGVTAKGKAEKFSTLTEDTRMQVRLEKPLPASGQLEIKMDFSFPVPANGSDRMGHLDTQNGEIFSIAQWYPRMCVYDDLNGWNTLPYLGAGEFYCEYGDVSYTVTAPADQILMGSGELLNPEEVFTAEQLKRWNAARNSDNKVSVRTAEEVTDPKSRPAKPLLTWKYKMKNTRDVAWASSRAFVLDAARINLPGGKKALAVDAHPVESNGNDSYGRGVEYVKSSVEYYSEKWFAYPYPMAVNIASNISGMEYPGIVFCGWKAKQGEAWGVIDHEFGHTWFPMIVGSNERRFGWMDEGFNTFINGLSAAHFNQGEYRQPADNMQLAARYMANPAMETMMLSPDAMREANIGLNLYSKPAWGLQLLREQVLGPDRFDYAFKNYISQWAYKHPAPNDFFRAMENGAGEDLSWFWKGWFLENWKLDQAITSVTPVSEGGKLHGYRIVIRNREKMPMPVILELKTVSGKTDTLRLPVDIWMRDDSWTVDYATTEELLSAELDPQKVLPDIDPSNNTWFRKS